MTKLKLIVRYVYGFICIIGTLVTFSSSALTAFLFIITGLFIIPKSHNIILEKLNITLDPLKRYFIAFIFFTTSCFAASKIPDSKVVVKESNPKKDRATQLLKEKIGNQLPFNEVKIASIENGTAVIVDGHWCYWIDAKDKIFCVNGSSKSIYKIDNPPCEDAPISAMFRDIEKIAK